MNCPACGKDTVDGAVFCQHCGARLGGCCPICGNPIVENALFCQCCGARLDAVKPTPAPVFVPAPAQGQADEPCKAAEEAPGHRKSPLRRRPRLTGPELRMPRACRPCRKGRMAITGGNLTN